MVFLIYAGDALWILALSIMAGASRQAWGRMDADTLVPMQIRADGTPGWRARRLVALCTLPGLALALSLVMMAGARSPVLTGDAALILFGVRVTFAAVFPLVHLRWLRTAMARLEAEGALKS
jgi:hypothetical protein